MNKKGQTGIVTFFLMLLVFIIIWAFWLASFLSYWGEQAITTQGLTGLEAFFMANLNLFIFVTVLISGAAVTYYGTQA